MTSATPGETQRAAVVALYDALAAGDRSAIAAALTDDFVGRLSFGLPFGIAGDHVGPEAMIRDGWFRLGEHWRVEACPETFVPLADGRLEVTGAYRGTGRRSGRPFEAPFTHTWTFRGDRIAALTQTTDSAAFRDALGEALPLATIDLDITDGLATISLDRPEARNAIDHRLADELLVAARRIARDTTVRAVLIRANGPDLTVGGDIEYFAAHAGDDLGALLRSMTTPFHAAFAMLAELEAPIVTATRGAVAGGGLGFVYAGDLVVAADDCRFVTAFDKIGLSGDGGGTWHLPRRIGAVRSAAAYLLGEPITAGQALAWGLVNEVVPAAEVDDRARALARRLAAGPTCAFAHQRRLLRESWDRDLPTQLQVEIEALQSTARSSDAPRAIAAFLAKRTPDFQGE